MYTKLTNKQLIDEIVSAHVAFVSYKNANDDICLNIRGRALLNNWRKLRDQAIDCGVWDSYIEGRTMELH